MEAAGCIFMHIILIILILHWRVLLLSSIKMMFF